MSKNSKETQFWKTKKKTNWFCNRPLSPADLDSEMQNKDECSDNEDTSKETKEQTEVNTESDEVGLNPDLVPKEKYTRKKDLCYFCETDVQNFVRHLKRNHPCESEVQKIFSYDAKSKERRNLLSLLKKKGNFIKNSQECVKPRKQARLPNRNYLPCTNCLGFYRSAFLYRHRKKCLGGPSKNAQSEGQNLLIRNHRKIDPRLKEEVFPRMRADKISLTAKSDFLICAFGARYLKIHREKHFVNVTSRKMRELSRILMEVKKIHPSIGNLFEILQAKYYDVLVEATKSVAKYDSNTDSFCSPTYAMNISTSLKQCCDIAIHMIIKEEPSVETASYEAGLKTMINLLQSNWRFDISNRAGNDINLKKFNKITIVPLATDLKLLKDFLMLKANQALKILEKNPNDKSAYNTLLETVYCRTILLNRKRPGELQRMLLITYESSEGRKDTYEEFHEVVTEAEKILLRKLKRVVIRGKRGRGVPVMFSADTQYHLKQLLKYRVSFLKEDNPYLFGKPGTTTSLCGYKVLAKYAVACGAKNPDALTCTRLRKHLATLTQLFNLTDSEIEQLSNFMGHTPGVHKNSYRLPDDVYQTAKISKLLILMEKGEAGKHKGKTLDEIPIDMDENLLQDNVESEDDENNEDNTNGERLKTIIFNKKTAVKENCIDEKDKEMLITVNENRKKRVLTPWTSEQKEAVTSFFKNHIRKQKPPKKHECEDLKALYPELLSNKHWLKIKVFIQNVYSKK